MDQEKTEEKAGKPEEKINSRCDDGHCHHHKAVAITLAVIAAVLIIGGVCVVGATMFHGGRGGGRFEKVSVERNFGSGMMREGGRGGMMGGSRGARQGGIEGKITKVDGNNLTINNGSSDINVVIQDTTSIYNSTGGIISKGDLKVDNQIIVRGTPNSSGVINAILIQVTQ